MQLLREAAAEFIGTFLLVLVGNSVTAILTFHDAREVAPVLGPLGWGLALILATCVAGGVSGAVLNPAVSVALASVGKRPWRRLAPVVAAQYAGAFVSAIVLYAVYFDSFSQYEERSLPPHPRATAQIFCTFPDEHVGATGCLVDQVVSTMVLVLALSAVSDRRNVGASGGEVPITVGLVLSGVIAAFSANCGAPLNPARDLAPRAFAALAGWGEAVFSVRDYNYFWVPVVGPHIGAVLGAWSYRLAVEMHWPRGEDSYDLEERKLPSSSPCVYKSASPSSANGRPPLGDGKE